MAEKNHLKTRSQRNALGSSGTRRQENFAAVILALLLVAGIVSTSTLLRPVTGLVIAAFSGNQAGDLPAANNSPTAAARANDLLYYSVALVVIAIGLGYAYHDKLPKLGTG